MMIASANILVPATLANLGSGFDALGVALDLHLDVRAELSEEDEFHYSGEGSLPNNPENLMHLGFRETWKLLGTEAPKVRFTARNPIPLARGMGSSSAALVAGAMAADALSGNTLGKDKVFQVTAQLEGHPDNVGPAVYGGFVAAIANPAVAVPIPLSEELVFVLGIPNYEVPTSNARAALKSEIPLEDAVFNLSRSALWVSALATGRFELLKEASRDRLHQHQRAHLMPGLFEAIEGAYRHDALAAFVGGAGPTIAALCRKENASSISSSFLSYVAGGKTLEINIGSGATSQI